MGDARVSPDETDPRWIEQAAAGQPEALGVLYERYSGGLYRLSLRFTRSPPDAWDVVHDVFAGLPEALRTSYEDRGNFRSWLLAVATHEALMKLRRREHRREVSLTPPWRGRRAATQDHAVDRIALDEALASLSPGLRAVFVLKTEGLSHPEIGEALGISVDCSRVRLCRAHRRLRELLSD